MCTNSLLFCAPEALALLSTACAHSFNFTNIGGDCLICPRGNLRGPTSSQLQWKKRGALSLLILPQPTKFCVALGSHIHLHISFHGLVIDIIYPQEMTFTPIIEKDPTWLLLASPSPQRAWGRGYHSGP